MGLPPNWVEKESSKRGGKKYYFNTVTRESVWERPTGSSAGAGGGGGGGSSDKKRSASSSSSSRDKKPRGPVVQVFHILKKHTGSRNATVQGKPVTRTLAEATEAIEKLRTQVVVAGDAKAMREKFAELAKVESDCSSGKRGGDLGPFPRGTMQPAFEEVAFRLEVNELSDITVSDSGVHVLLRVA